MSVLLVTYDLNSPGQKWPKIYSVLDQYAYAKLSESSYAVQTNEDPKALYEKLAPAIDQNDSLIVITLTTPWWGQHRDPNVLDWLKQRLR